MKFKSIVNEAYKQVIMEETEEGSLGASLQEIVDSIPGIEDEKKTIITDIMSEYGLHKDAMQTLVAKAREIFANPRYMKEIAAVYDNLNVSPETMASFDEIKDSYQKMLDNPNYRNRYDFRNKLAEKLKVLDLNELKNLVEAEKKLVEIVKAGL